MLLSPNVRREERVQRLQRRRDVRHGRGTAAGGLESFSIWNSTILRLLQGLAPLLCYIQEYISNWKTLEAAWLISTNKLSSSKNFFLPLWLCTLPKGRAIFSNLDPAESRDFFEFLNDFSTIFCSLPAPYCRGWTHWEIHLSNSRTADDANTAPSETDASESKSPPPLLLLQTANTTFRKPGCCSCSCCFCVLFTAWGNPSWKSPLRDHRVSQWLPSR